MKDTAIIGNQKQRMNVERALILESLTQEINDKASAFEAGLRNARANQATKDEVRAKFYEDLEEEYNRKFADQQASTIQDVAGYNSLSVVWWSLITSIPITKSEYMVAPSITDPFSTEDFHPWSATAAINWLLELKKVGTFFLQGYAGISRNNTIRSTELEPTSFETYKHLGGTDTVKYASLKSDKVYIGNYESFITPTFRVQVVFFPKNSDYGFSAQFEKLFGKYNPLNLELGIPIRLKHKDGEPTVNFKIQYKVADLAGTIFKDKSWGEKATLGISIGLPFSSIIY